MHTSKTQQRLTRALSLVLAAFFAMGLWPVQALQTLAWAEEEAPALAEEAPALVEEDALLPAMSDEDGKGPQVHLDNDNESLYSDQDLVLHYDDNELSAGYTLGLKLGIFRADSVDIDGNTVVFGHFDPDWSDENGTAYTWDRKNCTITLHGAWFWENYFKDHQDEGEPLRVELWVYHGTYDDGTPIQVHPFNPEHGIYWPREAVVDYRPMRDSAMLPLDGFRVDRTSYAWIEDGTHPGGEEEQYEVTNVELVSQVPEVAGTQVFEITAYDDSWECTANSMGTATFRVTYINLNGDTDSYEFTCTVADTTYDIEFKGSDWGERILPGATVEVWARGKRHTATPHTDDGGTWYEYTDDDEGLTYSWELVKGADIASIKQDPTDSSHVTLTVADLPEGQTNISDMVVMRADMFDAGANVASKRWAYEVSSDFVAISPFGIDGDAVPYESQEVNLELRHYVYGEEYATIDDARFAIDYNPYAMTFKDAAGNTVEPEVGCDPGTYTITRLTNWQEDIWVEASWAGEDDEELTNCMWQLNWLDYRMSFAGEDDVRVWVSRDKNGNPTDVSDKTVTVDISDELAAVEGLNIVWTVGEWDYDVPNGDDGYGAWVKTYDAASGLYTVSADGRSITSNGAEMAKRGIRSLRVWAEAKVGENVLSEPEGDAWFHLEERQHSYGFPDKAEMLPGWVFGEYVSNEVDVFLHDEEHDFEHETAVVTNVSVADTKVATVAKVDGGWTLTAGDAHGKTTATITYTDYDGTKGKIWTFPVSVQDAVYTVDVWGEPNADVLPGGSVEVYAHGRLQREDDYTVTDGFDLRWEVDESEDYTYVVDPADPCHLTITFRELRGNEQPWRYYAEAWPEAVIYSTDAADTSIEQARGMTRVGASADSIYIQPSTIERYLDVLASTTIDPQLMRSYSDDLDAKSEKVEAADLTYYWSFDTQAVRIVDANGNAVTNSNWGQNDTPAGPGPYTITRLRDYGTTLGLKASWTNEEGEASEWDTTYELGQMDYGIWFEAEEYEVSASDTAKAMIDISRFANIPASKRKLIVFVGDGNWKENYSGFGKQLSEDQYTVTEKGDKATVTIAASVVAKACKDYGVDKLVISAFMAVGEADFGSGAMATVSAKGGLIDISGATISKIADQTYTGKAITPKPTVKVDSAMLKEGADYTLSYKNNDKVGTATITVVGMGAYTGTKSATFKIVEAKKFPDVKAGSWYERVVERAVSLGLMSGYDTGKFGPDDNVTRGQIAVMLWNMAGRPAAGSGAKSFPDVKSGAYYYAAVRWASSAGVVNGNDDGTFRPDANVTREQLAVMLSNYARRVGRLEVKGSRADYAGMRDAAKVSSYAQQAVGWCFRSKILSGSNGEILPQGCTTRAQAAKMLVFLYDMLDK